jgi:hypothetical protein
VCANGLRSEILPAKLTLNRWILTETAARDARGHRGDRSLPLQRGGGRGLSLRLEPGLRLVSRTRQAGLHGRRRGGQGRNPGPSRLVSTRSYKLLHPFMPFMTEELWAQKAGEGWSLSVPMTDKERLKRHERGYPPPCACRNAIELAALPPKGQRPDRGRRGDRLPAARQPDRCRLANVTILRPIVAIM